MKRYLTLVLTVLCLIAFAAAPAAAARPQKNYPVTFNGHPILFDVEPELINDRTFVPFRAIFEKMGATVDYDGLTNIITAVRGSVTIKLSPGSETAYVNGAAMTLPAAPYIKNGRTLVPLRFVSEALGADVQYNDATTAISITDK
ncbi:MAG TPA: copper amine oxidase N-terminal domain-containing protein, partial [Symbiobacteriaceae bacterium]|nr:copper amine oxidase N-terminal domain-containing protein [Symbiobacteriaceae bacterium]